VDDYSLVGVMRLSGYRRYRVVLKKGARREAAVLLAKSAGQAARSVLRLHEKADLADLAETLGSAAELVAYLNAVMAEGGWREIEGVGEL
jgi:hypothetical protein